MEVLKPKDLEHLLPGEDIARYEASEDVITANHPTSANNEKLLKSARSCDSDANPKRPTAREIAKTKKLSLSTKFL